MPQLAFYFDGEPVARVKLPDEFVIGRAAECDVQLAHHGVSDQHLWIHKNEDGDAWIENLSTNGVRLNADKLYGRHQLSPGDRIYLRNYVFLYQSDDAEDAETPAPAPMGFKRRSDPDAV